MKKRCIFLVLILILVFSSPLFAGGKQEEPTIEEEKAPAAPVEVKPYAGKMLRLASMADQYAGYLKELGEKWEEMERTEVKYETYNMDDADVIVVAFGYVARVAKKAVDLARSEGIKAGLLRPIVLWPFPYDIVGEKDREGRKFVVAEDNLGQMIWDVRYAIADKDSVGFVGILDRNNTSPGGMILPGKVLEEIKRVSGV